MYYFDLLSLALVVVFELCFVGIGAFAVSACRTTRRSDRKGAVN